MTKCKEGINLHFLILSSFPHSLFISSFPLHFLSTSSHSLLFLFTFSFSLHFLTSRMLGCSKLCNPVILYSQSFSIPSTMRAILPSGRCTNCQWTVDIFFIVIVLYSHSIILSFSIPCTVRAILCSGKMHQLSVDSGHIHHIRRLIFTFH